MTRSFQADDNQELFGQRTCFFASVSEWSLYLTCLNIFYICFNITPMIVNRLNKAGKILFKPTADINLGPDFLNVSGFMGIIYAYIT